jgi:hypothetical protein
LVKNPDGTERDGNDNTADAPTAVSIFDQQGGTLLLEATYVQSNPTNPKRPVDCATWTTACSDVVPLVFYKVEVPADTPTLVPDSSTAVVQRDGHAYDVYAISHSYPAVDMSCDLGTPREITRIDLRIRDLSGITFETGALPTCIQGNAPDPRFSAEFGTFDGPVTYRGREAGDFVFDGAGVGRRAVLNEWPPGSPEPTIGQTFWATGRRGLDILRTSQGGDIVLASVDPTTVRNDAPTFEAARATIAQAFGITIDIETDCAYTSGDAELDTTVWLLRAVFGTTPPVTVRSGGDGRVTIAGQTYRTTLRRDPLNASTVLIWK